MFNSLSDRLVVRIPEISYLLSSILMIFASDFVIEHFFIKTLRRLSFITRTSVFLAYALLVLPTLTAAGAFLLKDHVLVPFKDWIIVVLLICFLVVGIFLSIKYNMKIMKIRLKGR